MNITLIICDSSNDGHGRTDNFVIESNLSKKEVIKAFKEGTKIVGFDLTRLCSNYEDSEFPKDKQELLLKHIKLTDIEMPDSYFEEGNTLDGDVGPETFAGIYLAISKLGNPKLEAKFIKTESIEIGGYGLYWC